MRISTADFSSFSFLNGKVYYEEKKIKCIIFLDCCKIWPDECFFCYLFSYWVSYHSRLARIQARSKDSNMVHSFGLVFFLGGSVFCRSRLEVLFFAASAPNFPWVWNETGVRTGLGANHQPPVFGDVVNSSAVASQAEGFPAVCHLHCQGIPFKAS